MDRSDNPTIGHRACAFRQSVGRLLRQSDRRSGSPVGGWAGVCLGSQSYGRLGSRVVV